MAPFHPLLDCDCALAWCAESSELPPTGGFLCALLRSCLCAVLASGTAGAAGDCAALDHMARRWPGTVEVRDSRPSCIAGYGFDPDSLVRFRAPEGPLSRLFGGPCGGALP